MIFTYRINIKTTFYSCIRYDRLIVKAAKGLGEPGGGETLRQLVCHGPNYVSPNTEIGRDECLLFFPIGYRNASETGVEEPEPEDETVKSKKKKKKKGNKGAAGKEDDGTAAADDGGRDEEGHDDKDDNKEDGGDDDHSDDGDEDEEGSDYETDDDEDDVDDEEDKNC